MHYYIRVLFILVLASVSSQLIAADQSSSPSLSIAELVDIALKNNPETTTAWWNARRAAFALKTAESNNYPDISFRGLGAHGYDYKFINSRETSYTTLEADLVLSYMLYDSGETCASTSAAQSALAAANWQTDWTLQKVMSQVIQNAYTFLEAQESLTSRVQSINDSQNILEAAQELNRVGLKSINDIYTLQANLAEMQMDIALQKAELDIARGKLATSLGLSIDSDIHVSSLNDPQVTQELQQDLSTLLETARQRRNDLMAKHAEIAQKQAIAKKTRSSYQPKISLNADGGVQHFVKDHANGAQYNVSVNVDVPLFNGYESIYQTRLAYSDIRISESQLQQLELEIALEVLTYSRLFEAAQQVWCIADNYLSSSQQSYDGILEKYRAGTQSIFDLTAAQKQLAEARLRHSKAKMRWYKALSQLAYATGTIMNSPCVSK